LEAAATDRDTLRRAMKFAASVVIALGLAAPAVAKEPARACSAAGDWVLKVAPVPEAAKCGKYKPSRKPSDERLLILQKPNGALDVRSAGPLVEEQHIRSGTNDLGGCVLHYDFTENMVPSGTPLYEHVEYELLEKDAVVSGLKVSSSLADMPGSAPVCTEISVVVGVKKPLSAGDISIDQAKAPEQFVSFYKRIMKTACQLPFDAARKRDVVAIRLLVGTMGELKRLSIDGVDQRIDQNCSAVVSEGRATVLSNPTGKDQTLEFGARLP
jgi:hypothetical protein